MENRKKELKNQYKQMKPEMGIYIIRNKQNNQFYMDASADIKSIFNRAHFQLGFGVFPCKQLQKEWKEQGENNFAFEILDRLEYSKDETKTDYLDDLATLKKIWLEKFEKEPDKVFYK